MKLSTIYPLDYSASMVAAWEYANSRQLLDMIR